MNPLYEQMRQTPQNNGSNIFQEYMRFKNSFKGNAKQQVQQLLNSGRVTQDQYNQAVQKAQNLQRMLGGR